MVWGTPSADCLSIARILKMHRYLERLTEQQFVTLVWLMSISKGYTTLVV